MTAGFAASSHSIGSAENIYIQVKSLNVLFFPLVLSRTEEEDEAMLI